MENLAKMKISTAAVRSIIAAVRILPVYRNDTPIDECCFLNFDVCNLFENKTTGEILQIYESSKKRIYQSWIKNKCNYSKRMVFEVWNMLEQRKFDCDILKCPNFKRLSNASLQSVKSHIYSLLKDELSKEVDKQIDVNIEN